MKLYSKCLLILDKSEKQAFNTVIIEVSELSALYHVHSMCRSYSLVIDSRNYAVSVELHQVVIRNLPVRFSQRN